MSIFIPILAKVTTDQYVDIGKLGICVFGESFSISYIIEPAMNINSHETSDNAINGDKYDTSTDVMRPI